MNAGPNRPIPEQPGYDPIRDFGPADSDELPDSELDLDMEALRRIAGQVDPVPSIVDELAMAAFETRNLDLQLAALIADSENGSELVRSVDTGPRMVSFEAGEVSVELQLNRSGSGFSLNGLVIGSTGTVVVETPTARIEIQVDESGWFSQDGVVAPALRLRVQAPDGDGIVTEWIST